MKGPGYVVTIVWTDDPLGLGVTLELTPPNESTARAAIAHYVKNYAKGLDYLFIETLEPGGESGSICSAEFLTSALPNRIFDDMPMPKYFPATVVKCFGSGGEDVYYRNCAAARAAGAAPVYRGEPGYGSHLDRDGDGVGCE